MEAKFWHGAWERNEIRFHEPAVNALLVRNLPALGLAEGARVLAPLCGKSLDVHYLLGQGFEVVGAELSEMAVGQLFEELGMTPEVVDTGSHRRYRAGALTVYAGDLFALDVEAVGPVDAVYDRAALVALPPEMRDRYAPHLVRISGGAPQLLACFEYGEGLMAAPPHSVDEAEVRRRYGEDFRVVQLERYELPEGLKGKRPAFEAVYLLEKA